MSAVTTITSKAITCASTGAPVVVVAIVLVTVKVSLKCLSNMLRDQVTAESYGFDTYFKIWTNKDSKHVSSFMH
jgi:hypothetical protein